MYPGIFFLASLGGGSGSNPNLLHYRYILEIRGFEPLTSSLQSWRSSQLSYIPDLLNRKLVAGFATKNSL